MVHLKQCDILVRRSEEDKHKKISLEYQEKLCRQKAADEGYEVAEVFIEEVSAYNTPMEKRPILQAILNRISRGETKALICWQKSRLVRDMAEEVILQKVIVDESDCKVLYADPSEIPMDGNSMNKLLNVIKGWQNENEVATLRYRVKEHIRGRARDGLYVGGTFTGLTWSKDHKKMIHIPGEIEVVKKIFTMYLYGGYSTKQIAEYLNQQNIKTRSGKTFFPYTICSILQNKIYCGYYRWGFTTSQRRKKPITTEGFENKVDWVEPIITLDEWNKVQNIMIDRSGKKRGQKRDYSRTSSTFFLLSGKVICGCCGKVMASHNGSKTYTDKQGNEKTSIYLRYTCRNSNVKHQNLKLADSLKVDEAVKKCVIQFIRDSDTDLLLREAEKKLQLYTEELTFEINSIEKKIGIIKQQIETITQNMIQTSRREIVSIYESEFTKKDNELALIENKKKSLEEGIKKLRITEDDVNNFLVFLESFKENDEFPRAKLIRLFDSLIDRVIINGPDIEVKLKMSLAFNNDLSNEVVGNVVFDLPITI